MHGMSSIKQALLTLACVLFAAMAASAGTRSAAPAICPRPQPGDIVREPKDLRSRHGVLKLNLTVRDEREPDGSIRYCYLDAHGDESPTLHLKPGDLLILNLKNDLKDFGVSSSTAMPPMHRAPGKKDDPCTSGIMSATSTNLHFHGLTVPPVCHQDDVLHTSIQPGDPPFQYRFHIPENEPPGLYWYHPHIHGFVEAEVLGGASGALIVDGIERADSAVAGLPERVLVIRDQNLLHPNAPPAKWEPVMPKMLFDRDGDAANTGTGFGIPAKDLSVNFVPVPYPNYPPAVIQMKPGERELWRVLNSSAITYLNLAVLYNRVPQPLGLVALDGVPLNEKPGIPHDFVDSETHLGVPPGARVEFIVKGPPPGVQALFVTRTVDTGPAGENDPNRTLAIMEVSNTNPAPPLRLAADPKPLPPPALPWLGSVMPVRVRHLYFSEKLLDPKNPNSATEFYITVEGQKPKAFDPHSGIPNVIAQQGTVEDWIIENRSSELHAFHIHQLHFMLLDYLGMPVNEPFLRDTVNVPYYNGRSFSYPSVRLRLDFRDPNTVGDFVYHCHILEHSDKGMMGMIRVLPARTSGRSTKHASETHAVNAAHPLCGLPPSRTGAGN